ncbi:isocitrate lyase [Paraferrimonas sp. SM1919]|uniref:isocitrate lyase n=1 Tax=Paraferrimonas sp. SM1919 TaxID=2662263 RepID=UPI0013D55320|nr:isocitrate lyase [Paraferrimonas sp. SM1919]
MSYRLNIDANQAHLNQAPYISHNINPEYVARMQLQNRFRTGLDIAKYTAKIMRADMAAYDNDPSQYTQSLGCWHGFIGQQKMISVKKHFENTKGRYLYLSGWMVAAMRSEFGPLPDQSMHEKTSVPALIAELYDFLKQADARELNHLYQALDNCEDKGSIEAQNILKQIDNFQTHVVPIIADIDAGFGNEEATYLLAKKMIEAGACCIQIENQVSDAKQCGHQDGKVTVPHEDFLAKINAVRYAFLELGVEDGVIVARTDSLGAGLTQKIPVSQTPGDLAEQYNEFIDGTPVTSLEDIEMGDMVIRQKGGIIKPIRLPNALVRFKANTGEDRVVLDCITSLQQGADLLWIETEKPHIAQIKAMVDRIREVVPNAKLVYNNSPSFNWTLNFRQQTFDAWSEAGKDVSAYDREKLMNAIYDDSELALEADERIRNFQRDAAAQAGIFHHLITLPTYHTAALSTDNLAKDYFSEMGMLAYVKGVQRKEIRQGLACVKHQDMSGSNIGDDHKTYFSGDNALKAGGAANTMNQFG